MEITFANSKLKESIEDDAKRRKRFGTEMDRKILLRMQALLAADSLAVFWPPSSGPERCHELIGDKAGNFSIDLRHPYRLLFKPADEANLPPASEPKRRWESIKSIVIVGIEDTHG